jgi:hypothetical protein
MHANRPVRLAAVLWLLLFIAGCAASPVPTLTLTIREKDCSLDGPMSVPYGELNIRLVIEQQKPTDSGYALISLKEGKTLADLGAWPSNADGPAWVVAIDTVHAMAGGTHTYTYDLSRVANPNYQGEPLYLACFHIDPTAVLPAILGSFGPIEVTK